MTTIELPRASQFGQDYTLGSTGVCVVRVHACVYRTYTWCAMGDACTCIRVHIVQQYLLVNQLPVCQRRLLRVYIGMMRDVCTYICVHVLLYLLVEALQYARGSETSKRCCTRGEPQFITAVPAHSARALIVALFDAAPQLLPLHHLI